MRTTLNLPEGLVEEARELLGLGSKTDTIVASLQETVRRRRIEHLISLMGKVEINYDTAAMRRRP